MEANETNNITLVCGVASYAFIMFPNNWHIIVYQPTN
jgi:hypothetical protein